MVATPLPMKLVIDPRLRHEAVDAEDEREPGDRIDGHDGSVAASVMKPRR
jgi:hypothetical protein